MKYEYSEAFCLMSYKDTAGNVEIIWNSRDGVTPFQVTSRQGNQAQHVAWSRDVSAPDHVPNVGDRVFEDQTEERVRKWRSKYIDLYWDHPEYAMSECYPGSTKGEVIEELVKHDMAQAGAPQLTEVTAEWLAHLAEARGNLTANEETPC